MVTRYNRRPIGVPVLDDFKKRLIVNMVSEGNSKRCAANVVGCAPSTITRTARRDRQFGLDLLQSEEMIKVRALRTMNRVADQDKHWRAAAWLLERLDPDRFALRKPFQYTVAQVGEIFKQVDAVFADDIPMENRRRAFDRLTELMAEYRHGQESVFVDMYFINPEDEPDPEDEPEGEVEPTTVAAARAAAAKREEAQKAKSQAASQAKEAAKQPAAPTNPAAQSEPKAASPDRSPKTPPTEASGKNPSTPSAPPPSASPTPEPPPTPGPSA